GKLHLQLTAGMLGLGVIFILAVLFGAAVLLAIAVARRQRRATAAHLELGIQIAARQLSQRELEDEGTLLQTSFESIGEGIVVCDVRGEFLLINPAAHRILQTTSQESFVEKWRERRRVHLPDGTLFPASELPLARATR